MGVAIPPQLCQHAPALRRSRALRSESSPPPAERPPARPPPPPRSGLDPSARPPARPTRRPRRAPSPWPRSRCRAGRRPRCAGGSAGRARRPQGCTWSCWAWRARAAGRGGRTPDGGRGPGARGGAGAGAAPRRAVLQPRGPCREEAEREQGRQPGAGKKKRRRRRPRAPVTETPAQRGAAPPPAAEAPPTAKPRPPPPRPRPQRGPSRSESPQRPSAAGAASLRPAFGSQEPRPGPAFVSLAGSGRAGGANSGGGGGAWGSVFVFVAGQGRRLLFRFHVLPGRPRPGGPELPTSYIRAAAFPGEAGLCPGRASVACFVPVSRAVRPVPWGGT